MSAPTPETPAPAKPHSPAGTASDGTASPAFRLEDLTPDQVTFRRASHMALVAFLTTLGTWLLVEIFSRGGFTLIEWAQLILFIILFSQIATGFSLAFFGFIQCLCGGDRLQIMNTLPAGTGNPEKEPLPSTAIILPVFNEDVPRVFAGLENMYTALERVGYGKTFDFFILSDSNRPDRWIEEECAWIQLCRKLRAFGRIFYRKRRISVHGKSGNVADFCRRWGAKYRYMIVLDADSIMTGETLVRLVRAMEKNPQVGLIQTMPNLVLGRTLFRRFVQFAARLYGAVFAAGSNYWHLGGGNYWGHNAIIRLQPFIEHCDLPDLPEKEAAKRHILSHDTVEAALMRRAGYDVWFAYLEEGSYEEGPPNLTESLKRDRRWLQGNLQHFWFLGASNIDFSNRIHIWMGLMGYLSSPIWLLFMAVGTYDLYQKVRFDALSALPSSPAQAPSHLIQGLFALTMAMLFLPKVFSYIAALPRARQFGGVLAMTVSVLIEVVLSVLLAPVLMIFYTRFVFMTMLGMQVKWTTQNRSEDEGISWSEALSTYSIPTTLGFIGTALAWTYLPHHFVWMLPILTGLCLSAPLAVLTSRATLGLWMRKWRLFLIPEEAQQAPPELQNLDQPHIAEDPLVTVGDRPHSGLLRAILDPYVNAIHVALLRQRQRMTEETGDYLSDLREKLLEKGPEALTAKERLKLLWDAESMAWLHEQLWLRPNAQLDNFWLYNLHHYNEDVASPLRRLKNLRQIETRKQAAAAATTLRNAKA